MITCLVRRAYTHRPRIAFTTPHILATVPTAEHDREQDRHRPELGDHRGRHAPSADTGGTSPTTGPTSAQVCVTVGTGVVPTHKIVMWRP
jgi:hypothetical protein